MLLGGVCAALSVHLGWPVVVVRSATVLLALLGGGGVLLYLWLWSLVPLEPASPARGAADAEPGSTLVNRALPVAGLLTTLALLAGCTAAVVALSGVTLLTEVVPGLVECTLLSTAAVVWTLVFDRTDSGRSQRFSVAVRTGAAVVLVGAGSVALVAGRTAATSVLAVAMIVLGVAVLFIPRIVALWTDLLAERSARAREVQHSEIAAHLHDSVLQTLAIIQNRAGPQSEIARLARAQERELRDWLFAGTDPFGGDLATELRSMAAALELEHAVRIDIVTAGEVGSVSSAALAGAAREAMVNAARHVGGDVSVYVEAGASATEVFVRDRGRGFDLDAVPERRLGIRESIVGRMARAGGTATVASSASGTEVHLRLPASGGTTRSRP